LTVQTIRATGKKVFLLSICLFGFTVVQINGEPSGRTTYNLDFDIEFEHSSLTGREVLSYVNQTKKPVDSLFFHLYPNYQANKKDQSESPIRISAVSSNGRALKYDVDQEQLKVYLSSSVAPDEGVQITIEFTGQVPLVTDSMTNTLAHLMRELSSAAVRKSIERRGNETFLRSDDVMLLGFAYPILAVQNGQKWQTGVPDTMGDMEFSESADYRVKVTTERGLVIAMSGLEHRLQSELESKQIVESSGEQIREFGIIIGRNLAVSETSVGATKVRSIFRERDASVGKNLLTKAADAVSVYASLFGQFPYPKLDVVEAPLLPGHSEYEFSGLVLLAGAYYIDFKGPSAKSLPGFIREQASTFEEGFEFTAVHGIAHQWWGEVVECNPYRHSFLDEALAGISSVLYLQHTYNKGFANQQVDAQVKAAYRVYRAFGGNDLPADSPLSDFNNEFQFSAIVQTKGTLFLYQVLNLVGEKEFGQALSRYFQKYQFRIANPDDLLTEISADLEPKDRDAVHKLYHRWLHEKHGDQDIGTPPIQISIDLGSDPKQSQRRLRRFGRFFLTIGKTAVRPF